LHGKTFRSDDDDVSTIHIVRKVLFIPILPILFPTLQQPWVSAISRKSIDICWYALTDWGRGILNYWSDPAFCQWNGSCHGQAQSGRKGGWISEKMKFHQPRCAIRGNSRSKKPGNRPCEKH